MAHIFRILSCGKMKLRKREPPTMFLTCHSLSIPLLLLLKALDGSEAWVPINNRINDVLQQQQQQQQQQQKLFSIHPLYTEDYRNFGGGWTDNDSSRNWYKDNADSNSDVQNGYFNQPQQQQGPSYNDNDNYNNEYSYNVQQQTNDDYWYNNEEQQQMSQQFGHGDYENNIKNLYNQAYVDRPNFDNEQPPHQQGYHDVQNVQQHFHNNKYPIQGGHDSDEYPHEYYGSSSSSTNNLYSMQQQQTETDSYQHQHQHQPSSVQIENGHDAIQRYNGYCNDDRQGDYNREEESQGRSGGGDWQVRMEQQSYSPPPQQPATRNHSRRSMGRVNSPILGSIFMENSFWRDRFFDNAFDSMFSSPFDDFFVPLLSTRRRRRRDPFFSPFEVMMPWTRSITPYSMLDLSMDDNVRSMMRRRMPVPRSLRIMANDPMFQRRLLEQAKRLLNVDVACTTALGWPIQMGVVISQSSSASAYMINGQQNGHQQQQCQLQVSVRGSHRGGVVRIVATDGGIQTMILSVVEDGGYPREINVRLPSSDGVIHSSDGTTMSGPDVVDAEIVDQDERRFKPVPRRYWAATV
jgi:hypothetical protein